ncbi:MAG: hypothetical protein G8345_13170 [Magnetococcales bacterium]|nr:hypothetical protein [Magnetococcales bacterium]NGZ27824.1 hypothetical protein [Magnetococcales bacterium]
MRHGRRLPLLGVLLLTCTEVGATPCNDLPPSQHLACLEGVVQGIALYDPQRSATLLDACTAAPDRRSCLAEGINGSPPPQTSRPSSPWRIEAALGYGQGRHDGTFEIADSPLHLSSALGGAGMTRRLSLYAPANSKGWGWGVDYLLLHNTVGAKLNMPNGVSILTDPVLANAHASAKAEMVFFDVIKSFPTGNGLEPYLGAGLGIGWGRASLDYTLQSAVISPIRENHTTSSWIPAVQALGGVRWDGWQDLYLTLGGRMIYFTGKPFNVDHSYLNLSLEGGVGAKF